jgi:hypothetical protein
MASAATAAALAATIPPAGLAAATPTAATLPHFGPRDGQGIKEESQRGLLNAIGAAIQNLEKSEMGKGRRHMRTL